MRKFGGKLKNPLKVTWIVSGQTRMFLDAGPVLHIYLDSFWEGLHWPEVIKSSAAGIPMSLGRSWVPLAPGRIPSVTSGKPVSVCQRLQVERPLQWHNIWRLKTSMPQDFPHPQCIVSSNTDRVSTGKLCVPSSFMNRISRALVGVQLNILESGTLSLWLLWPVSDKQK
jgi:hypothetical protein